MWQFLRELPLTALRVMGDFLEWLLVASWEPLIDRDDEPRSILRTILRSPFRAIAWVFRMGVAAVAFPVSALFLPAERRNRYLRGLPALLGVAFALAALAVHSHYNERIVNRYLAKVQSAFAQGATAELNTMSVRVVLDAIDEKPDRVFAYSIVRRKSGDLEGYEAILERLAPIGEDGFPDAHLSRALDIVSGTNIDRITPEQLDALSWHLNHCGEVDSEQMHNLWSYYYRAKQDWEQAEASLRAASRSNSRYLLPLSDFLKERGKDSDSERVLTEAVKTIATKLNENPLSKSLRLELVVALNRLKRTEDAERVLVAGVQLHRDDEMRQALSDFYVMMYEQDRDSELPLRIQLSRLMQALRTQPNSARVYQACTECFLRFSQREQQSVLEKALEESMVDGGNIAMAHFLLGAERIVNDAARSRATIPESELERGRSERLEEANWHVKQAIVLDRGFVVASNNYARVLLFGKEVLPQAALALASLPVESEPRLAVYWDTFGEALAATGDARKSFEAFAEALRLEPSPSREAKWQEAKRRLPSIPGRASGG